MTDLELYNKAKEAYYNGEPIMTDYEFDELEKRLGLENKSYIGAKHNPSYTVKHPFIMGSLSKVQIKRGNDGNVPWEQYFAEVLKYIHRYEQKLSIIATPKYDGCSFEAYIHDHQITHIASRGDGTWGKDIKPHLIRHFDESHTQYDGDYTLRGEVLIKKSVFAEKYSDFVNPRSFVSGLLNRDYDENDRELNAMLDDLSIVIYDTRYMINEEWRDYDWTDEIHKMTHLPEFYQEYRDINLPTFQRIYNDFEKYREECPFALDGIVIKPVAGHRVSDLEDVRPKDCVAIKFIPMLEETEIVDVEWNLGKTGEFNPVIIVKPVIMDGKQITRASAHNYGYMIDNKLSIGTKVILSLAGDIIPFIYKITNTDNFDQNKMNLPDCDTYIEGCHLYKYMTELEQNELEFIESANALKIPQIGPAAAKTIFDYMYEQSCGEDLFFDLQPQDAPNNILFCKPIDIERALGGKLGVSAKKSYIEFLKGLTIKDIIVSCSFIGCGYKIAEQIENQMLWGNGNFEHFSKNAYKWCFDENSLEMGYVKAIMEANGINVDDYKIVAEKAKGVNMNQTPVILTGEPNTCSTKAQFLQLHPEYRMTTSWKEVKIVFTNSLDSNTGKMKKAREKGIEIRLY